jgi:hypothetical protein
MHDLTFRDQICPLSNSNRFLVRAIGIVIDRKIEIDDLRFSKWVFRDRETLANGFGASKTPLRSGRNPKLGSLVDLELKKFTVI